MASFDEFMISGLPVRFPYEPYDVQKAYMSKVLSCLQVNKILSKLCGVSEVNM